MPASEKFYIVLNAFLLFATLCIVINIYRSSKKKCTNIFLKISLAFTALGLLDLLDMLFIEPNWIATEWVKINDPELAQILRGMTVVQISDIHLKEIGFRERELVKKVNELKPDILCITGDFFSNPKDPEAINQFREIFDLIRSFKASVGIYGILGNYDTYLEGHPERLKELSEAGICILYNESRKIIMPNQEAFWLAGTFYDPPDRYAEAQFEKTLENVPPHAPTILLNHYPNVFGKAFNAGINLVLAGHTHGGQIGLPFLIHMSNSANKSPYMRGLFDSGKTKMYVNRGIGTTNIPVRFLCRPEITVFEFTG